MASEGITYTKRVITKAPWRSGYAGVCKTSYTGSNPVGASNFVTNYCFFEFLLTSKSSFLAQRRFLKAVYFYTGLNTTCVNEQVNDVLIIIVTKTNVTWYTLNNIVYTCLH